MELRQLKDAARKNPEIKVTIYGVPQGGGKISYIIGVEKWELSPVALTLRAQRGQPRQFKHLETAVNLLTDCGIYRFTIDHSRCVATAAKPSLQQSSGSL